MKNELKKLIEKYQSSISKTCSVCGVIEESQWKDCGCQTEGSNNAYEQVIVDLQQVLNSENESSGSDVQGEHGALHGVRIWNASDRDAAAPQTSGELPLGSRTDTERRCVKCGYDITGHELELYCPDCYWKETASSKGS